MKVKNSIMQFKKGYSKFYGVKSFGKIPFSCFTVYTMASNHNMALIHLLIIRNALLLIDHIQNQHVC